MRRPDPPASRAELHKLRRAIERGEGPVTLGPKARAALDRILTMQDNPPLLSITSLAERLEVNPSTVTRLARRLGYPSFGAFQRVLLLEDSASAFYSRQTRAALGESGAPVRRQAVRLCRENQANIDSMLERFDADAFEGAVALLMGGPRVAVHGIRQFRSLASFLVYGLRMIRSDVSLLDGSGLGAAEEIAAMRAGDVLLATSCAPYSREVVRVLGAAAEHGLRCVALTDSPDAPFAAASEHLLCVPHDSSFLSNSLVAFVAMAECLINACANAQPDAALRSVAQRDRLIRRLDVE